jgi:hypothetical protein
MKKTTDEILGKIPTGLTITGIVLCLFSVAAIAYAVKILFY